MDRTIMNRGRITIPLMLALACTAGVVADEPAREPSTPKTATPAPATEVIELDRQVLEFRPTRDDISVARAELNVMSLKAGEVRVNGNPMPPGNSTMSDSTIKSQDSPRTDAAWMSVELKPVSKNRFELAPLKFEFPAGGALFCMNIKVYFREVTLQYDSMFYENVDDRYALVAYATRADGPDWPQARPRFRQNRVGTVKEFKATLEKPFVIKLNRRALREEWSR